MAPFLRVSLMSLASGIWAETTRIGLSVQDFTENALTDCSVIDWPNKVLVDVFRKVEASCIRGALK